MVIIRLFGALVRAAFVIVLIALPSLILTDASVDGAEIVALVALFGAALTIFEYAPVYPCLIEFRDAPPFNRIRFFCLFVTVLMLSLMLRGHTDPTPLTEFVYAVGAIIGQSVDFPYSPVRLVTLLLPETADAAHITLVRSAAGLSFLVGLLSLAIFILSLRVYDWPARSGSFNVWINLPTFDPTAGGDVVERLERDARFNIAAGFLLPFLTPIVLRSASDLFGSVSLDHPQSMIWVISAWAFLPASLFMRSIAMGRIAAMIEGKRRQTSTAEEKLMQAA